MRGSRREDAWQYPETALREALVNALIRDLRREGLEPPRFEDRVATFGVTFPSTSLLDEERRGELSRREIAAALNLGDPSARQWLAILRREKQVVMVGPARSPNARYRLPLRKEPM